MTPKHSITLVIASIIFFAACSSDDSGSSSETPDFTLDGSGLRDFGTVYGEDSSNSSENDIDQEIQTDTDDQSQEDFESDLEDLEELSDVEDTEDPPKPSCESILVTGETWTLAPELSSDQFYPRLGFDGRRVWLVFGKPDDSDPSTMDIYLTALRCDGTVSIEPFRVNVDQQGNHVDPRIAVHEDRILVTWTRDDSQRTPNLDILYRVFDGHGEPITPEDVELNPIDNGSPVLGGSWMSWATPTPFGGFVVTGAWGIDDAFQILVQKLNQNGGLVGSAFKPFSENTESQSYPTMVSTLGDKLYLAWRQQGSSNALMQTYWDSGQDQPALESPVRVSSEATGERAYYGGAIDDDHVYLVGDGPNNMIFLKRGTSMDPDAEMRLLGEEDKYDHTPAMAIDGNKGIVTWLQVVSGSQNRVMFQFFEDFGTLTTHPAHSMTEDSGGPSSPDVVRVLPNTYFMAWSEGSYGSFKIKGRFLTSN